MSYTSHVPGIRKTRSRARADLGAEPAAARVTMQTLARELNLSHATVSYVLNDKAEEKKIPPETVRLVLEAARRHQFVPNYWARSLARQKPSGIGIVVPDLGFGTAQEIMQGIHTVLKENAEEGAPLSTFLSVWFWDSALERIEIESLLAKQVAGLICLPNQANADLYRSLRDRGFPLIFLTDTLESETENFVMIDGDDAVRKILSHFVSLGHRRIALIGPDNPSVTNAERYAAFAKYTRQFHADPDPALIIRSRTGQEETVHWAIDQALALQPRPTAFLAMNDTIAYQMMHQLTVRGLQVGTDVAIAGIGDLPFSRFEVCSLTSVQERRIEFSRLAARLLLDQITHKSGPVPGLRVKGDLIVRRTSCNPQGQVR